MASSRTKPAARGNVRTGSNISCSAASDIGKLSPASHQSQDFLSRNALRARDVTALTGVPSEAEGDLRLFGIGLNLCERALNDCAPVVLDASLYARLCDLGICGAAVNGRGPFDALNCDAAVFLSCNRFEFARDMRDQIDAKLAVIIPARDESGTICDLVAWNPDSGAVAIWRGMAPMLGEENLHAARFDEPLFVHETVADWLRSGRDGIFIFDDRVARLRLANLQPMLGVWSLSFGRRLHARLTVAPNIVVAKKVGVAI